MIDRRFADILLRLSIVGAIYGEFDCSLIYVLGYPFEISHLFHFKVILLGFVLVIILVRQQLAAICIILVIAIVSNYRHS